MHDNCQRGQRVWTAEASFPKPYVLGLVRACGLRDDATRGDALLAAIAAAAAFRLTLSPVMLARGAETGGAAYVCALAHPQKKEASQCRGEWETRFAWTGFLAMETNKVASVSARELAGAS